VNRGPKSANGPAFVETCLSIIEKNPPFDNDVDGISCMDLAIKLAVPEIAWAILGTDQAGRANIDVNHHPYFTTCMAEMAEISIPQNQPEADRYGFLEELCMQLMDAGCSVNVPLPETGSTPLELAIDANSSLIVDKLLSSGNRFQYVMVDKVNAQGQTVLIQCLQAMTEDDATMDDTRYSFLEQTALRLVDYGANHENALQFAVQASHKQMVEILMSKDVELDVFVQEPVRRKFPGTSLENPECAELLSYFPDGIPEPTIKTHAEMQEISAAEPWGMHEKGGPQGDGQLFTAVDFEDSGLWMMGTKKSDVPLLYCMMLELEACKLDCRSGERVDFLVDICGRFIDAGAKVRLFHHGESLLDVTINTDEIKLVEKMMDRLDDIDLLDVATGSTVLYRLLTQRKQRIESGDSMDRVLVNRREDYVHDVASLLLSRGAELHISGPHGSLFDCAIGCGAWEVCGLILEQSSMYGYCDAGGVPYLHKVLMALNSDFVIQDGATATAIVQTMACNLVDRGCDVNQEWDGRQPLDEAISNGSMKVVNYLLQKGAIYSRAIVHALLSQLIEVQNHEPRDEGRIKFLVNSVLGFIASSADVDVEVDGVAPLTLSIEAKNKQITQEIIKKSKNLRYPSVVGRQLLDAVIGEIAQGGCAPDRVDYAKEILQGLALQNWFVLQETMNACGDNNNQANEVVLYVLDNGADFMSPNPDQMHETPLHAAAANGLKGIAKRLLEKKANVDARNEVRETPLIKACLHGKNNMIEELLKADADINAVSSGAFCSMGPLHIAAATEMPEMVEKLLRWPDIEVNLPGHFGRTALHEAFYTSSAHPEVSEELVYALLQPTDSKALAEAKAVVNQQDVEGATPLMLAAKSGYNNVVRKMLIECDADVEITDNQGNTVYDYAVMGNQHAVFTMITRKYPLPEAAQKRVIMHAIKAGMDELLEELMEVGGRVNVLDARGHAHPVVINVTWDEPLWWAAYFGKADLVARLAKSGCNVAVCDAQHRTLFHWCSMWGLDQHTQVLKVLCEQQSPASYAPDASGMTPFDVAVLCGNSANAMLLGGEEGAISLSRHAATWEEAKEMAAELEMQYVDHSFGANLHSLCMDSDDACKIHQKFSNVEWKRPNELVEGSVARLDLSHLSQVDLGCCGNAWLLSSVLTAMEMPYGLTSIFEQREIVKEGCYSFVFKFGGAEEKVVVDDRIPCLEGTPMYGGFGAGNNIAFMLLEKALAKLVGSYEGLSQGSSSELFRVSPIGQALFEVCKAPEFVEDAELTELVREVCKSACIMMLESTCAMYGDHASPDSLMEVAQYFTHEVDPGGMGISLGAKHVWASEPKRVLPGTGSCSCQEPVVSIRVNVKSRVRVELDSPETAENIRIYQTAPEGQHWNFVWRHAVPGSLTEFDLLLEASQEPYILFFTQMGTESSKPCYFNLWSDKDIVIDPIDNNEDMIMERSAL